MTRDEYKEESSNQPDEKSVAVMFTDYFSFLAVLNLMWVLTSLLIIPISASTEAVFRCINKKLRDEKVNWKKDYFEYVKKNIWSSIKRGWAFFLVFLILILDGVILFQMPENSNIRSLFAGALVIISILFVFIFFYYYAFLTITTSQVKERLIISLIYSVRYPHYSIGILIILIAQIGLSLYFVPLLFFFSISFPAFLFLYTVFKISEKQIQ